MKKLAFIILIFFVFGCSDDSIQNEAKTVVPRATNPAAGCGSYACNIIPNINSSNYSTLCAYQDALLNSMNGACTLTSTSSCFSSDGLTLQSPVWENKSGRWVTTSTSNSALLTQLQALGVTNGTTNFPNGPICDYDPGNESEPSNCSTISLTNFSTSNTCPTEQSGGWTVSGASINAFMNTAFQAACSYGKTISCAPGRVFKPSKIEYFVGSASLCGGCVWSYCPQTGKYFIASSCEGYTIHIKVTYDCCTI
jgi:hypothetical protein